ncbi:hypothetical protein SELMODRAFT_431934 [Selaginella moellendorffii]|uniref:Uncharacterized protein n=1 Tax=Selaginella moellendorffii TaxID=88036 RepID=D8TEF4_SELML|nr:hypothetical protein SELMODRAFT_431934 [Selaginella moellendorffii]
MGIFVDGQFANHVKLTDLDPIFKQLNEKNVVLLGLFSLASVNRKPVWVLLYADSAFDAIQQLVGVACVDIVTNNLLNSLGLAVVQDAVSKRSPGPSLEQKPLTSHPILEATTGCDFAGSLQSIQDKSSDFICCGANCSSNNVTATSSLGKHSL